MSYAALMIKRYQSRGLLLDSNLLILHLVGTVDPLLVGNGRYNKLSDFKVEEIAALRRLSSAFRYLVTTAHVLTEVSNLVGDMRDPGKSRVFQAFVDTLEVISEQEISSYQAARRRDFPYMGLTDSVLAELSSRFLVVSKDGRMVNLLRDHGSDALKWVEVLGLSV